MSVEQIETAIERLSAVDRLRIHAFVRSLRDPDDAWDERMSRDAEAGKFDELIARAEREAQTGQLRDVPLP